MTDPFSALGLARRDGLTDDDIRMAWRRVAAATHPDRDDGGDPAAFAAAAAAYSLLRTQAGRGEARADGPERVTHARAYGLVPRRLVAGRPARFALRVIAAAGAGWLAVAVVGWQPASAAVIAGALTWLIRTARSDLA
jgi:hypothetical protein